MNQLERSDAKSVATAKSHVPNAKCPNAKTSSIWEFYLHISIMYTVRDVRVMKTLENL